jgi:putative membrane protein
VKVQAVTSRQNWFQRRLGLTTLTAHVAGPGAVIEVMDAGAADAAELHRHLSAHAASPTHVVPSSDAPATPDPAATDPSDDDASDASPLPSDARTGA